MSGNDKTSDDTQQFITPSERFTIEDIEKIYAELKRIAHAWLRGERKGHTLCTTALVNETLAKLMGSKKPEWENPAHFFDAFARNARWVLIDHARKKTKQVHGQKPVELEDVLRMLEETPLELYEVDDLLESIPEERVKKVAELKIFGGLTAEMIAKVLDVSVATVKRDWAKAKDWLRKKAKEDAAHRIGAHVHDG